MSIGSTPNNVSGVSGVDPSFYQPSKVAPNVNVPTVLPPGGEGAEITLGKNEDNVFSLTARFGQFGSSVRRYFRRIGLALFGIDNREPKQGLGQFQTPQEPLNSPVSAEPDPVIGNWPSDFAQSGDPFSNTRNSIGRKQSQSTNPSSPFTEPQDDFGNLLGEINQNQMNQQNLSNWIQ